MAEQQQQSAKLVEMNKALAAGMASVVTALFTSKLGVAGTLIGTALTAIAITLIAAILKAQIERAQSKLSGLPSTVRGRLSTQQFRVPGRQDAEPNPEPPPPEPRGERPAGLLERLRTIPSFLRELSPSARRRVLLSGALAGVVATAIGLSVITFTETVAGEPLSSLVGPQRETTAAGGTGPRTSVGSLFGGSSSTQNTPQQQGAPQQNEPAGSGQYQQRPGVQPQQGNPAQPAEPAPEDPAQQQQQQQQPGGTPQYDAPAQPQPGAGQEQQEPDAGGSEDPAPDQ
jgi:hypothetical protein